MLDYKNIFLQLDKTQKIYKILDVTTGSEVFFQDSHDFKTPLEHAKAYIKRNKGKFHMKFYQETSKPKPFPRWELIDDIEK